MHPPFPTGLVFAISTLKAKPALPVNFSPALPSPPGARRTCRHS